MMKFPPSDNTTVDDFRIYNCSIAVVGSFSSLIGQAYAVTICSFMLLR
ncbi:MAG: hypothetical protein KGY50_04800 [Candidatus Thermoplasmatota archaeon]|nr:hypothetical protein [Candidatus Thermoplasmatota archaeon]